MPVASACAPAKPYRHAGPCADLHPRSPAPARSKLYNPRHPERTGGIDAAAVAQVQAEVRTRILRAFAGRGLIERFEAREMLVFKHSGFSVNAGVRIEARDRAGLEWLLRYCARAPFALELLRQRGAELVYHCP